MPNTVRRAWRSFVLPTPFLVAIVAWAQSPSSQVGREVAIPVHLQDGEESNLPVTPLIQLGARLFNARFTAQEGAGRPLSKGTGDPLSDLSSPLVFPRNFDRISSPDSRPECTEPTTWAHELSG